MLCPGANHVARVRANWSRGVALGKIMFDGSLSCPLSSRGWARRRERVRGQQTCIGTNAGCAGFIDILGRILLHCGLSLGLPLSGGTGLRPYLASMWWRGL